MAEPVPLQVFGRPFRTGISDKMLPAMQRGVLSSRYRGRAFVKCPFDVIIYMQLLDQLRPGTVIEIGSWQGGSAVWFADTMQSMGLQPRVLSLDIQPPQGISDPRVRFARCDSRRLETVLTPEVLAQLPRPWLVSEDSAHTFEASYAVLKFFDQHMQPGEYIVIEDGVLSDLARLGDPAYAVLDHGPNRAVKKFLEECEGKYEIDAKLADHFGLNVTYNPNGWLKKVG